MRLLAAAAIALLSFQAADAQQLAPRNTELLKITFVNATFDDAIGLVAKHADIKVQFDDTATRARRITKLTLKLLDVTLEEALDTITREARLNYKVLDPQTILVYQWP